MKNKTFKIIITVACVVIAVSVILINKGNFADTTVAQKGGGGGGGGAAWVVTGDCSEVLVSLNGVPVNISDNAVVSAGDIFGFDGTVTVVHNWNPFAPLKAFAAFILTTYTWTLTNFDPPSAGCGIFDSTCEATVDGTSPAIVDLVTSDRTPEITCNIEIPITAAANTAPTFTQIQPDQDMNEGDDLGIFPGFEANDAEGDPITFTANLSNLDPLPAFIVITDNGDGTANLEIAPSGSDEGTYEIDVMASDLTGSGGPDTTTFVVTVSNIAPELDPIGNTTVNENVSVTIPISASDAGNDPLTFSFSGLPAWATVNYLTATTAEIVGTPNYNQSGVSSVTVGVDDNYIPAGHDEEIITITVNNVNQAPVLAAIGNKSVDENATLEFTINGSDGDGADALTYSATNLPSGATFTPATRTFSWTPGFGSSGNYPGIIFTVTDNGTPNLNDSETINISVGDVNRPPVLAAIGSQSLTEGVAFSLSVLASDPDGDGLALTNTALPTGANFTDNGNGTADFSWTPAYDQEGTYFIRFTVTDNNTSPLADAEDVGFTVLSGGGNPQTYQELGVFPPEQEQHGVSEETVPVSPLRFAKLAEGLVRACSDINVEELYGLSLQVEIDDPNYTISSVTSGDGVENIIMEGDKFQIQLVKPTPSTFCFILNFVKNSEQLQKSEQPQQFQLRDSIQGSIINLIQAGTLQVKLTEVEYANGQKQAFAKELGEMELGEGMHGSASKNVLPIFLFITVLIAGYTGKKTCKRK